jgi:isopenicillin N synthase-like dioxygenase
MLVEETRPKAGFASADISTAFSKIPLVDYRLKDANPAQFHADLRYAMAEVGFMLLENVPGFDAEFQAKVLQQGHDFFGLDDAEKLKTDIRRDPHFRGCARQDRVKDVRLNVNIESYHFGYEFEESTDPAAPLWKRVLNGPNQWPDPKVLPEFRPTVEEYFARCELLGRDLFKGICRMLGADEGHATRYWTDLKDESALYFLGLVENYRAEDIE